MHTMHETPPETPVPVATHHHAVIWLDHHTAHVIHFGIDSAADSDVHPVDPPRQLHIKSGTASGTHVTAEPAFFRDVGLEIDLAQEVLLVGPASAKTELMTYLDKHSPLTAARVKGVETLDKVTENQLLAEGRKFFNMSNRVPPEDRGK